MIEQLLLIAQLAAEPMRTGADFDMGEKKRQLHSYMDSKHTNQSLQRPKKKRKGYHGSELKISLKSGLCEPACSSPQIATTAETKVTPSPPHVSNMNLRSIQIARVEPPSGLSRNARKRWRKKHRVQVAKAMEQAGTKPKFEAHRRETHKNPTRSSEEAKSGCNNQLCSSELASVVADPGLLQHVSSTGLLAPPKKHWIDDKFNRLATYEAVELPSTVRDDRNKSHTVWQQHMQEVLSSPAIHRLSKQSSAEVCIQGLSFTVKNVTSREVIGEEYTKESGETPLPISLSKCVQSREELSINQMSEGTATMKPLQPASKTGAEFVGESSSSSESGSVTASSDESNSKSLRKPLQNRQSDAKTGTASVESVFKSQRITSGARKDPRSHSPYWDTLSGRLGKSLQSSPSSANGYASQNDKGTCETSKGSNGHITHPLAVKYTTSRKASNVPTHYNMYDPREAFQRFSAFIEGSGSGSSSDEESDSDRDDYAYQAPSPMSTATKQHKIKQVNYNNETCQGLSTEIVPETQEKLYNEETVENIRPSNYTSSIVLNSQPDHQLLEDTKSRSTASFQTSEIAANLSNISGKILDEEYEDTKSSQNATADDISDMGYVRQHAVEVKGHGPFVLGNFAVEEGNLQIPGIQESNILADSAQGFMKWSTPAIQAMRDDKNAFLEDRDNARLKLGLTVEPHTHTSLAKAPSPNEKLNCTGVDDLQDVEDSNVEDVSDDEITNSDKGELNMAWFISMSNIHGSKDEEEGNAVEVLSEEIPSPLETSCIEELDGREIFDSEHELEVDESEDSDIGEDELSELVRPALWSLDKGSITMEGSQENLGIELGHKDLNEAATSGYVELHSDALDSEPRPMLNCVEDHEAATSSSYVQSRHAESDQELYDVQQSNYLHKKVGEDHDRAPPEMISDLKISRRRPLVSLQPEWLKVVDERVQTQLMNEMVAANQPKADHAPIAAERSNTPNTPNLESTAGESIDSRALTQMDPLLDKGDAQFHAASEKLPKKSPSLLEINHMFTPTESTILNDASIGSPVLGELQRQNLDLGTKNSFLDGRGGIGFGSGQNIESLATPNSYRFAEDDDEKLGRSINELTQDVLHTDLPYFLTESGQHPNPIRLESLPQSRKHPSCTSPIRRRSMLEVSIPKLAKDDWPIIVYTAQVPADMQAIRSGSPRQSEETPVRRLVEESSSSLSELGRTPTPPGILRMDFDESQCGPNGSTSKRKKQKMTGKKSEHFTPKKKRMCGKSSDSEESLDSPSAQLDREIAAASQTLNSENIAAAKNATRSGSKRKSTGKRSEHFLPLELIDRVDLPLKIRHPAGISRKIAPSITSERFGIIQEKLWREPFWLLVAVTFLNKTGGKSAGPTFWGLKERFPTPQALAAADEGELHDMIHHLGLQNQRSKRLISLSKAWLSDPPVAGRRYKTLNYPQHADHTEYKEYKKGDAIEGDREDCKGALEIGHMPGCGPYAWDSWRIFCRDVLRNVAEDYNGKGAADGFQPEWQRVLPLDKELRATLRWMWLREGWIWNHETGEKRRATAEEMEKAFRGEIDMPDDQERKFAAQAAGVNNPKNHRTASSAEKPKKGKKMANAMCKIKSAEGMEDRDSDYVDEYLSAS